MNSGDFKYTKKMMTYATSKVILFACNKNDNLMLI